MDFSLSVCLCVLYFTIKTKCPGGWLSFPADSFVLSFFSVIWAIKEGISWTRQEWRLEISEGESDLSYLSRVLTSAGMNLTG